MTLAKYLFLFLIFLSFYGFAQVDAGKEAEYTKTITLRAEKIVEPLGIPDAEKAFQVRDIVVAQYRKLNDIYTERDNREKAAKALKETNKSLAEEQIKNAENEVFAQLYILHFDYLSKLQLLLTPEQVDQIKDGMTYGVLPITYKGYCDMVLGLTEEQKLQMKIWLAEAREHAMDAGSSDEKHAWFGKYKGRINNYLSAAGFDMKKEGEEWQKRIKAAQK